MATGAFGRHKSAKQEEVANKAVKTATAFFDLQVLVITDPYLMMQLLHNKALLKPAQPDYIQFRQASAFRTISIPFFWVSSSDNSSIGCS